MTDVTYYERCETQDGRTLEYLVEGDPNGFPLVHHHGTPGAAVPYPEYSEAAAERGLALIQYSRAGYGESTPRPDRTVADVAEDIAAILDRALAMRIITTVAEILVDRGVTLHIHPSHNLPGDTTAHERLDAALREYKRRIAGV